MNGSPNPERGVSLKAVAVGFRIKILTGPDQAEVPLLDQIVPREPTVLVVVDNHRNQFQVCQDQLVLRGRVARLDPLGQCPFLNL